MMSDEALTAPQTMAVGSPIALAKMLAQSDFIPKHYQKNAPNCLVAIDYAVHMREPVLAIMRVTFVVHGQLGFKSEYLIGRANASGIFDRPITFEEKGEAGKAGYRMRAGAPIEGEMYWGPWVTWEMCASEGWLRNDKYKTMPEVMFRYRSATLFVRSTCPQVLFGAQTVEELEDMGPRDVTHEDVSTADKLNALMSDEPTSEEVEFVECPDCEGEGGDCEMCQGTGEVVT